MTNSRCIRLLLAVAAALCASGAASAPGMLQSATPPEMYSFADVYRLTVSGTLVGTLPPVGKNAASASAGASTPGMQAALAESAPVRPVAVATARGEEARFLVGKRPEPDGWLMVLAGFVLAGWVAARRLA